MKFQMFKLDLEKAEEPEFKLPTSAAYKPKVDMNDIFTLIVFL